MVPAWLCFLLCAPPSSRIPRQLNQWIVTSLPKENTRRWDAANYSHYEWHVAIDKGKPIAHRYEERLDQAVVPFDLAAFEERERWAGAKRYACKVDDGWLVGYNKGEWGGAVYWFSSDGTQHYKISHDQVIGFVQSQVGLLAPQGLAHLGLDEGSVVHLDRNAKGHWQSETWIKLNNAPRAATLAPDGSLVMATTRTLERITPEKQRTVLLKSLFWWGMYPNSLVIAPSGEWFVGMRHGVVRVQQTANKTQTAWLLPNKEFVNAKPDLP